jgi:hypothetical protein
MEHWIKTLDFILKAQGKGQERIITFFFFEIAFCYVAQAGLKLEVLLPLPPYCWDCRYALPHLTQKRIFLNKALPAVVCSVGHWVEVEVRGW